MTLSQIKRRLAAHSRLLAIRRIERIQDIRNATWAEPDDLGAYLDRLVALAS